MRGKKAIQQLIIVLFVIIAIGALLVFSEGSRNVIVKIGDKQALTLSAYTEAEKTRDYYTQIARLAVQDTAKELGMNLKACIMSPRFTEDAFLEKASTYSINYDLSSNSQLTVISPKVAWAVVKYPDKTSVYGSPEDVDPRITVSGENFKYDAGLFVSYTFCESKCGDGLKQGTEECDSGDLGGKSCGDYTDLNGNRMQGDLKCTVDTCKYDTSGCFSGGGGGGGCIPNWGCDAWAACTNGLQSRVCYDQAACGTARGNPSEDSRIEYQECCADSDGDAGWTTKGTCIDASGTYTDYCTADGQAADWYCANNICYVQKMSSSSGSCSDGRWVY